MEKKVVLLKIGQKLSFDDAYFTSKNTRTKIYSGNKIKLKLINTSTKQETEDRIVSNYLFKAFEAGTVEICIERYMNNSKNRSKQSIEILVEE